MIILLNYLEGEGDINSSAILPMKWAAVPIDKHLHPKYFVDFVLKKIENWSDEDSAYTDYLVTWILAACIATNKTSDKAT